MEVIPVAEARAGLSRALAEFRQDPDAAPVIIGSHRRPEAVLLPYDAYMQFAASDAPGPTLDRLRRLAPIIGRLAQMSRLSEVRVFGSVARGEQTAGSDVDLLVTPDPDATLFDIAQFELDMEALIGAPVTVVPVTSLDAQRDAHMLREAVVL